MDPEEVPTSTAASAPVPLLAAMKRSSLDDDDETMMDQEEEEEEAAVPYLGNDQEERPTAGENDQENLQELEVTLPQHEQQPEEDSKPEPNLLKIQMNGVGLADEAPPPPVVSDDDDSLQVAAATRSRYNSATSTPTGSDAPPLPFITIHDDFDDYQVDYEARQFDDLETGLTVDDILGADAPPTQQESEGPQTVPQPQRQRVVQVQFESVQVREYNITIGDHPFCSKGAPITLDWDYHQGTTVPLELYESSKKRGSRRHRRRSRLLMDPIQRRDLLWRFGCSLDDIERAAKDNEREKFRQSINLYMLPLYVLQEFIAAQREKATRRKRSREAEKKYTEAQVRQLHRIEFMGRQLSFTEPSSSLRPLQNQKLQDTTPCPNCRHHHQNHPLLSTDQQQQQQQQPLRRITLRGSRGSSDGASVASAVLHGTTTPPCCAAAASGSVGSSAASSSQHHALNVNNGTQSITTSNVTCTHHSSSLFLANDTDEWSRSVVSERSIGSEFSTASTVAGGERYKIRTDPRQHDKATEIILCSIERPHMRAFHASWFGFFIGFVMWFAITPLLGEVKETLGLTNADIWTSSLCGTAVTILARVIMGPLCDVFGARKCMAAIVIVSAIPCGLTGLCNTATGLSAVRAFVGIAGSAFVPCQYWTSRMFAREVAGTANALVAGWGNLGGGITQLLMGAGLFPLFVLIYSEDDNRDEETARELAWRTVFVIPSIIAFMAAYVYIYHCEDSPKGDYAELVRQQQIEIVSPFWSLGLAIQNRNVILLLIQYACCFGVEITMTNATALYMKEEFAQDTVSAAAIASVFGIMNLFARGLGGYGSDVCQAKYGTKGRVWWQSFTLFMEGMGIVVFAHAETLVGAIFSLIFLSLWVQCAEGSTYGIVPYVNRRYTGAVVGWIGGGGTLGGVIFSIFFREFSYQTAFVAMGLTAAGSAFLSIFMNMKSLAAIYQEKLKAEHIKNNNNFVFHDDAPAPTRDRDNASNGSSNNNNNKRD